MKLSHSKFKNQRGQAMILTVLVLSSIVLSLSAIGGYLMMVRLRVSTDIGNTMRAIYIADAGLGCEAYNHFKNADAPGFCAPGTERNTFTFDGTVADAPSFYHETETISAGVDSRINAKGYARTASRSLHLEFGF
ncbi:MAG: hypothetical protein UW32_C0001G0252 [Candidatus Wolfebacteria bacterium GW2011_GWE2_44_13]|uniref:Type 4 fimbrial biogenesis protein PilX N-terminal domain-containing protein n=1 Tax=Candidatus Wolfebacteria bacterium GW2011_GWE2_44_13 TaxID=1619017 RepID=A0A0G1HA82_9BACT|nr:MAG: hypothetical protein UW32_C0001G0252 [Candidatus Wolfebacteria bacterium GW2011_GWE2_44_13]